MGLCSSFMLPQNVMTRSRFVENVKNVKNVRVADSPSNFRLLASKNEENESSNSISRIWTMSDLYKNIEAKKVSLAVFSEDSNNNQVTVLDTNGEEHSVNLLQADLPTLVDLFRKNGVRFAVKSHGSKEMTGFLSGLASVLIPFTFLSLMFF